MDFDKINEETGFANGDLFNDENEVREYFTIESMKYQFGGSYEFKQTELDEMAELVIENKWHMKK